MGMNVPTNSQLTLRFEVGLAERHLSLRDCLVQQVYSRGHGRVANLMDVAPSKLTEKLAGMDSGGKPRGLTVDELERYIDKTGDTTPVLYLVDKYLRDPQAQQQDALARLASLADQLPALLSAARLSKGKR